ncbi:MAG TPA: HD domain-containing phosphohydrolase [Gemmatimonadales bacterium]|jgi:putative nucleotidyltransferase with HDIG domain
MSDPVRFLTALSQTLSSVALYGDDHPATARAQEKAHQRLLELQASLPRLEFTFLGKEVLFGEEVMNGLQGWDWNTRLSEAGIERLEFTDHVDADQFTRFLDQVAARLGLRPTPSSDLWQMGPSAIRFGQVALRDAPRVPRPETLAAVLECNTDEERQAVEWINHEVASRGRLPVAEADAVVRSLSITMHMQRSMMVPLLELKEYDQYTTTHAMNVSVLAMAVAEYLGLSRDTVRNIGMAGLLHDLGKIRIPLDILNKPGKLSPEERAVVQAHPVDGARILLAGQDPLDLAALVAYEHHIMIDGGGYPCLHFPRNAQFASRLVHVCDVYDALRTKRPYREAWESERAVAYIEQRSGTEFDPEIALAFSAMLRKTEGAIVTQPA